MADELHRLSEPVGSDIQAVTRASQILAMFRPDRPVLAVAEAAAELRLNRTTTHRYFNSLVAVGLLDRARDPSTFVPGPLLVQLGAFALGRRAVVDLAPAHLAALSRTTHLTSALTLWGAVGPVVTRVEEDTANPVIVSVRVGHQLPVDAAHTKVFLAFLPDQMQAERLLATLPDAERRRLAADIDRARATGMASVHLADLDITAVAAAVFDESGICAVIALIGTARILSAGEPGLAWHDLAAAAYLLSKELGGEHHYPHGFLAAATDPAPPPAPRPGDPDDRHRRRPTEPLR